MNAWMIVVLCCPAHPATDEPPTWCDEVRAIVETNCVRCHQTGGPAPFPLTTHAQVQRRRAFITEVVRSGTMPPPLAGAFDAHIAGSEPMSEAQRRTLVSWLEAGAPLGSCEDAPLGVPLAAAQADLGPRLSEGWTMPSEGGRNWGRRTRDKRTFVVPIGNAEPIRVQAMRVSSTVPEAVHAITLAADTKQRGRWMDDREEGVGHRMIGDLGFTPSGATGGSGVGERVLRLPAGFHWAIEGGADLVAEVHFRPDGRAHELSPVIDLELAPEGPSRPVRTMTSMVRAADVPVDGTQTLTDVLVLEHDVDLVALTPRANGVCTALSIEAVGPDDRTIVRLDIDDWDPHWRRPLLLREVVRLPAGTVIRSSWSLANTRENPRNPFVPLDRYSAAMRTGIVAWLLQVAAVNEDDDERLEPWAQGQLMLRQRS